MKPVCSFVAKFASLISWALSCFDRVIFKGHLPISRPGEFEKFVDHVLKIRRADFTKVVGPKWSERLVEHAKGFAEKHGRCFDRPSGKVDKDAWAKELLQISPVAEGLIGVLCVMEACWTFNPAREEEVRIFAAVLGGDHIAQGFRNKDIRENLYAERATASTRRRQSAAIGRLLKRLHVRALISKVPHTRRWRVTDPGRRILTGALKIYHAQVA
jgi:hypothetical protein